MGKNDGLLFSDLQDVEIWAFGNIGEGGRIKFRRGDETVPVDLSPALFDTLAALMLESRREPVSEGEPWVPRGFITVERLCRTLKQMTQGTRNNLDPDRGLVPKYVLRLRQKLDLAVSPALDVAIKRAGTPKWTKELIQKHTHLGYRLAVHPDRLHLVLGQAPPTNRV